MVHAEKGSTDLVQELIFHHANVDLQDEVILWPRVIFDLTMWGFFGWNVQFSMQVKIHYEKSQNSYDNS